MWFPKVNNCKVVIKSIRYIYDLRKVGGKQSWNLICYKQTKTILSKITNFQDKNWKIITNTIIESKQCKYSQERREKKKEQKLVIICYSSILFIQSEK